MKKNTVHLIGVAAVIVVIGATGIYAYLTGKPSGPADSSDAIPGDGSSTQAPAVIKSFAVQKPNFIIKGENLSRVEIWATLAGNAQSQLGTATLQAKGDTDQTWTFPIPKTPVNATAIYVYGYDQAGIRAARIDLPSQDLPRY